MGRVSQSKIHDVATELAKIKYQKAIDQASDYVRNYATNLYRRQVPKPVMAAFNASDDARKYIKTEGSVKLFGSGFNYEYVDIDASPAKRQDWSELLTFEGENNASARKLRALITHRDNVKLEAVKFADDMKQALTALGTSKRIVEEFPELEGYFKQNTCVALMPQMDGLHKTLKSIAGKLKTPEADA